MQTVINPTIVWPAYLKSHYNTIAFSFFIFLVTILLSGCSTKLASKETVPKSGSRSLEMQQEVQIKTSESDQRPVWTKQSLFKKDGNIYFTGGFLNGADYSLTIRCANAEAMKVAIQSISQFIRAEFSDYAQGNNNHSEGVNRYVADGIATLTNNIHIQGIRQKDIYYEELFLPTTKRFAYNVFVVLEMSENDHLKAKIDAISGFRDKMEEAGQLEAKQKAEDLLDKLKKEARQGV
jgi:uncharacterized protein YceK